VGGINLLDTATHTWDLAVATVQPPGLPDDVAGAALEASQPGHHHPGDPTGTVRARGRRRRRFQADGPAGRLPRTHTMTIVTSRDTASEPLEDPLMESAAGKG
jgi:hypothetical protein